QDGADHQRGDDADRQGALRIYRFFRRRGHRVEADVGEENQRGAGEDAEAAEVRLAIDVGDLRRDEGMPIGRIDVRPSDDNEDGDGGELDDHHDRVESRRFADADRQQYRQQQHDDHGRHIGDAAVERGVGQRMRQMQPEQFQDLAEVARPADGYGGG